MVWKARQPVLDGLDARAERIRAELDEAQRLREEAQKALAEYKRKQRDAAKEAEDLLANAKHEAELLRRQAAEDLKETLARREKAAIEKIAQAETQARSEEHTSELQSLMRISYAVFCLKKKNTNHNNKHTHK